MSVRAGSGRLRTRPRLGGVRAALLIAALLALPGPGRATGVGQAAVVTVSARHDLVSVDAEQVEWPVLLAEFTRRTGIELRVHDDVAGSVSVSFRDLPVERALERLFGTDAGFVFAYRGPAEPGGSAVLPFEVQVFPGESQRSAWRRPRDASPVALAPDGQPVAADASQEGEDGPEVVLEPDDEETEDGEDASGPPSR